MTQCRSACELKVSLTAPAAERKEVAAHSALPEFETGKMLEGALT